MHQPQDHVQPENLSAGPQAAFRCSFVDGACLEIRGDTDETYVVQFEDAREGLVHQCELTTNQWARTARIYFTDWEIRVYRKHDQALVFRHRYDCQGKRVYIALESSALGDTLAWFPAVEAFRQKHGCSLICSTFMNSLFKDVYPDIEFVEPGVTVHDLYAMYRLGWFYQDDGELDFNKNVQNVREQPIGQSAYDILGLGYVETRPRLKPVDRPRPLARDYVCIAVHATAQAKYWNNPGGWDQVVRYLRSRGYEVVLLSREGLEHMGNRAPKRVITVPEGPLENIINYLIHARLFIGIGSGLSWLSWAAGCRTCLISGFSYPYSEMQDCIRVFPRDPVCTGCFNRYRLDPGDWNWCPDRRDTPEMFECTTRITGQQVIDAIQAYL